MSRNSDEQINRLQREIDYLQNEISDTQKEIDSNLLSIKKMYRLADLLQSFIPGRDKWRDVFLSFAN
jgi:peptidoglycan hydrolase CwlO-like protein